MAEEKLQLVKEIELGDIYSIVVESRDRYRYQMLGNIKHHLKSLGFKNRDMEELDVELVGVRINDKGFSQDGKPIVYVSTVGKVYFDQELAIKLGLEINITRVEEGEHMGKICLLLNDPSSWELSIDDIGEIVL